MSTTLYAKSGMNGLRLGFLFLACWGSLVRGATIEEINQAMNDKVAKVEAGQALSQVEKSECQKAFDDLNVLLSAAYGGGTASSSLLDWSLTGQAHHYVFALKMAIVYPEQHGGWPYRQAGKEQLYPLLKEWFAKGNDPFVMAAAIVPALDNGDAALAVSAYNSLVKVRPFLASYILAGVQKYFGSYPAVRDQFLNSVTGGIAQPSAQSKTATVVVRVNKGAPASGGGDVWKYWDSRNPPETGWQQPGYDDSAWKAGPAPLGYSPNGEDGEVTVLDFGGDVMHKTIAYYFRKNVDVTGRMDSVLCQVRADDGAVVYVNGHEVWRNLMPDGPVTATTYATSTVPDESRWYTVPMDASIFKAGRNMIAAEVHQADASSSDVHFEMSLLPNETRQVVAFSVIGDGQTLLLRDWIEAGLRQKGVSVVNRAQIDQAVASRGFYNEMVGGDGAVQLGQDLDCDVFMTVYLGVESTQLLGEVVACDARTGVQVCRTGITSPGDLPAMSQSVIAALSAGMAKRQNHTLRVITVGDIQLPDHNLQGMTEIVLRRMLELKLVGSPEIAIVDRGPAVWNGLRVPLTRTTRRSVDSSVLLSLNVMSVSGSNVNCGVAMRDAAGNVLTTFTITNAGGDVVTLVERIADESVKKLKLGDIAAADTAGLLDAAHLFWSQRDWYTDQRHTNDSMFSGQATMAALERGVVGNQIGAADAQFALTVFTAAMTNALSVHAPREALFSFCERGVWVVGKVPAPRANKAVCWQFASAVHRFIRDVDANGTSSEKARFAGLTERYRGILREQIGELKSLESPDPLYRAAFELAATNADEFIDFIDQSSPEIVGYHLELWTGHAGLTFFDWRGCLDWSETLYPSSLFTAKQRSRLISIYERNAHETKLDNLRKEYFMCALTIVNQSRDALKGADEIFRRDVHELLQFVGPTVGHDVGFFSQLRARKQDTEGSESTVLTNCPQPTVDSFRPEYLAIVVDEVKTMAKEADDNSTATPLLLEYLDAVDGANRKPIGAYLEDAYRQVADPAYMVTWLDQDSGRGWLKSWLESCYQARYGHAIPGKDTAASGQ